MIPWWGFLIISCVSAVALFGVLILASAWAIVRTERKRQAAAQAEMKARFRRATGGPVIMNNAETDVSPFFPLRDDKPPF